MLQRGDLVPHFTVKTLHGDEFSYATIWQRRNLVLSCASSNGLGICQKLCL